MSFELNRKSFHKGKSTEVISSIMAKLEMEKNIQLKMWKKMPFADGKTFDIATIPSGGGVGRIHHPYHTS